MITCVPLVDLPVGMLGGGGRRYASFHTGYRQCQWLEGKNLLHQQIQKLVSDYVAEMGTLGSTKFRH